MRCPALALVGGRAHARAGVGPPRPRLNSRCCRYRAHTLLLQTVRCIVHQVWSRGFAATERGAAQPSSCLSWAGTDEQAMLLLQSTLAAAAVAVAVAVAAAAAAAPWRAFARTPLASVVYASSRLHGAYRPTLRLRTENNEVLVVLVLVRTHIYTHTYIHPYVPNFRSNRVAYTSFRHMCIYGKQTYNHTDTI